MRFPLSMSVSIAAYILRQKLAGTKKFPLVLMLEPLHACNLTCTGCGRIREYVSTIREKLSIDECLQSVDECPAPVVSICGGEPMIYPGIGVLTARILERGKSVYLCTNGMFIKKKISEFRPSNRFFFNVHLDGMEKTHDIAVEREGVFKQAIEGIRIAKEAGFLVCTNTTIFAETDMDEVDQLFGLLKSLGVDGHMISPAYSYQAVHADGIFMDRAMIQQKFLHNIDILFKKYKLMTSPIYLEFLKGERQMQCTAWGNPTRNFKGWKGPCYLITDTHHKTFRQLIEDTPWEKYGYGRDPRCENCMVHVGYEASAVVGLNRKLGDTFRLALWQVT